MWIALCVSLVGVLYTIIFAGILLRIPEVASFEQRRNTANSGLGKKKYVFRQLTSKRNAWSRSKNARTFFVISAYSVLVVPMLVFLVLLTNKLDSLDHDQSSQIRYFSVCSPLYLTFFTLIIGTVANSFFFAVVICTRCTVRCQCTGLLEGHLGP